VKADGYKTGLTHRVGRRPSAAPAAEVPRDALVGNSKGRAVVIPVAVAIMIPILLRCQCGECDEKKNGEDGKDFRESLPRFARGKGSTTV
jgi:hypothetical protein